MSKGWMAIYGGFFLAALLTALLVTGLFQERILPRITGRGGEGGVSAGGPEERGKAAAPAAAGGGEVATAGPVEATGSPAAAAEAEAGEERRSAAPMSPPTAASPTRTPTAPRAGAEPPGQLKRLARVYEAMRPKEAAAVLEKVERPFAADILLELRERQSSKILAAMSPGAAAELTRILGAEPDRGRP